jgi:hypothetical protein
MTEKKKIPVWVWVVAAVVGIPMTLCSGAVLLAGAGASHVAKNADTIQKDIHAKVATDAVAQYGIAKRGGDAMQTCVQAGLVAAAYLQAKDEASYNTWKTTEKADCAAAGLPR